MQEFYRNAGKPVDRTIEEIRLNINISSSLTFSFPLLISAPNSTQQSKANQIMNRPKDPVCQLTVRYRPLHHVI